LYQERERARATLVPNDFRLDDQTYGWALDRLGSNEEVDRSVFRFVNHYRQVTGRRSKSRDWIARARNWIDDDASKQQPDKSVVGAAKRLHEKLVSFNARPDAVTDTHWESVLSTYAKTQNRPLDALRRPIRLGAVIARLSSSAASPDQARHHQGKCRHERRQAPSVSPVTASWRIGQRSTDTRSFGRTRRVVFSLMALAGRRPSLAIAADHVAGKCRRPALVLSDFTGAVKR
jgi:hypothetical protein